MDDWSGGCSAPVWSQEKLGDGEHDKQAIWRVFREGFESIFEDPEHWLWDLPVYKIKSCILNLATNEEHLHLSVFLSGTPSQSRHSVEIYWTMNTDASFLNSSLSPHSSHFEQFNNKCFTLSHLSCSSHHHLCINAFLFIFDLCKPHPFFKA